MKSLLDPSVYAVDIRAVVNTLLRIFAVVAAQGAFASPTDLDPSFGDGGVVRFPGGNLWFRDAAAYADGPLALLLTHVVRQTSVVLRLDLAGHVDPSFIIEGGIDAIAATPNGELATLQHVASTSSTYTTDDRIIRYRHDGSPDLTFGEGRGVLVSQSRSSNSARLPPYGSFSNGLAVDPGGRLYTSSYANEPVPASWITQIDASGTVHRIDKPSWGLTALRVQNRRTLIASVPYRQPSPYAPGFTIEGPALVRLVDGVPDRTFGIAGLAFQPMRHWNHRVEDFVVTPDGGYAVVGIAEQRPGEDEVAVVKFTASGRLDTAFGESGVAFLALSRPGRFVINVRAAVQEDGRVVVVAQLQGEGASEIGLGRLTVDGRPDLQFSGRGVAHVWVDHGTGAEFVHVRSNGRIVVAGNIFNPRLVGAPEAVVLQFIGGNSAQVRALREGRSIEYFHVGYGHYFVTADAGEIIHLDLGRDGWTRTGRSFRVWDDDDMTLAPMCRFWSNQTWAPTSSHFYTPYESECVAVMNDPAWTFERKAFSVKLPEGSPGSRSCPAGSQPLYRAYNNGMTGAPNHRYTTDAALLDQMIAQGWSMEGEAQTRVFACVPEQ
jgi:uncharacterized delta-60 repeat protein